ncbi:MAG: diguanylate cyclase [Casimicrobiaceae bacterium]
MLLARVRNALIAPAMRPVLLIPLFGALLVAALWVAVATRLDFDHRSLLADARQDVETFAASFQEHTVRALRDVDRTALVVKHQFERDDAMSLTALARDGLIPVDGVMQVSITDARGNVIATTHDPAVGVNVADHDYFRVHQEVDTTSAYISPPVVDRITRQTAIAVTRRLNRGEHRFAGVVIVAVEPRYLSDFYQERYLGANGLLTVIGTDGKFRVRRIGATLDTSGDASRATVFARAEVNPIGSFRAKSAIDGVDRLFAYRKLRDYPLILVAGRAEAEVTDAYHARRLTHVSIAAAVTAAILAFFGAWTVLVYRLRRSEQRAQQAETLFRAAADAGLDAFAVLRAIRDRNGNAVDFAFAEVNPRGVALLGLGGKTVRGRRLSVVLRRAGCREEMKKYLAVLDTGDPLEEQLHVAPPGRDARWLRHQAVRVLDGVALFARDITDDKHHEEQLRQQQAFMEALVGNLPVAVMVRNAQAETMGRIVLWNHAAAYLYGIAAADAIGRTFRDLAPPEFARRAEAWDRRMLASPMVQEAASLPIESTRGRRYIDIIRAPIFDIGGQVEFIISIATDVTGDKARQDELRLASKVFETTADAVLVSDADDRVIMVNQAFTDLTGYGAEEVRGRQVQELPFATGNLDADEAFVRRLQRDGKVSDELVQYRKDGRPLPCWATASCVMDDAGNIANFVRVFSDISDLKASQAQLERLANYDPLTGLPNRRLFQDRLQLALHRGRRGTGAVALLFIDLDGFKEVNDSIGHDVGDLLLRAVSARLAETVRVVDSVSRLGGDEFTVVIENGVLPDDAIVVARRILEALAEPFDVAQHRITTSASVGIALFPADGADATTLLRNADAAMYQAKRAGRNRYALFTPAAASTPAPAPVLA